ncbi:MAG: tRNA (N6-threonylcarbamoyladenosine(37)-N6)-methyltransferase TrmO [Sandaracinaceae bacterium]
MRTPPRKPPQDHTHAFGVPDTVSLSPVAVARSPYKERFGTPRQASVTAESRDGRIRAGVIELLPHVPVDALRSLDGFDYVWAIYVFHLNRDGRWSALVRPPRDPHRQHGVLATRAPHRPNPIGLSALRLDHVEGRLVHVHGLDLLDGTPILDLKPYVPYADAFPDARAGWVDEADARERELHPPTATGSAQATENTPVLRST